jgi:hypothetical protein
MSLGSSYTFDTADDKSRSRRRRIAEQLMMQGMETTPIQSPWQGAARMAQALMGGIELGMEDKKERETLAAQNAYGAKISEELAGFGGGAQSSSGSMSPVTQAMMPPEQVKAIIDANVPEADRPFAYRMAEKESAFNPSAVSPTGAKGLFQFTGGTWGDVTGQAVGRGSDGRADPVANTKAFVELTRRNREALRGVLGREPSPGELAVAHQQGVGGATALLTGKGTVNPRNLAVQAGNPKNAQDIMRYYGFAPDQGQGGPIQVAQAGGSSNDATLAGGDTLQGRGAPSAARLMEIATDRNAPPEMRERARLMLQSMPKPRDPLDEEARSIQVQKGRLELDRMRNPQAPPPPEAIRKLEAVGIDQPTMKEAIANPQHPLHGLVTKAIGGSGVTVNTNVSTAEPGDKEFFKKLDEGAAKRWETYKTRGDQAQAMVGDLTQLREISKVVGQQGAGVNVKAALGPYAEALGIDIKNLSDIQTFESIVQRLAPQLREPGSGSTSDIEFKGFLKSIGPLSNNPQARERIIDTFEAFARHDMAKADIATRLSNREISRTEAEKEIRALPDPLSSFRQFKKESEAAAKGGNPPPAAGQKIRRYNEKTSRFEEVTQ